MMVIRFFEAIEKLIGTITVSVSTAQIVLKARWSAVHPIISPKRCRTLSTFSAEPQTGPPCPPTQRNRFSRGKQKEGSNKKTIMQEDASPYVDPGQ
jgi:hypothetical protein